MLPILYEQTETDFTSNGIGILSECLNTDVEQRDDNYYELWFDYPVNTSDEHTVQWNQITDRSIIRCKPSPDEDIQTFRVYSVVPMMGGIVQVKAAHISYDLSGFPVQPFDAYSAAAAMTHISSDSVLDSGFTFWTDIVSQKELHIREPMSIRAVLAKMQDIYGGEFEWDNKTVRLYAERGVNRGVSIRYGKNLTDFKQERNCAEVYTGIYPYWRGGEDDAVVELPEKIIYAEGTFPYTKIMPLDLSANYEEQPTVAQLRASAENYLTQYDITAPVVSMDVSFVQLEQTGEYENLKFLERVSMYDTLQVYFPSLNVSSAARVASMRYNPALNKITSVVLGDKPVTIADSVADTTTRIDNIGEEIAQQVPSMIGAAVDNATKWLTSDGGNIMMIKDANDKLREIVIIDTESLQTASKVWRWNVNGLGYSSTGYAGPYSLAMTQDGAIVANMITTGILNGNIIRAGAITSIQGNAIFDLEGNSLLFKDGNNEVVFSFDPQNGLVVNGHIEANSGNVGAFTIGENGELTGVTSLQVGSMILMGNSIQNLKVTAENMKVDSGMYTPPQFFVRGNAGNFSSLHLDDLLDWIGVEITIGGTTYQGDVVMKTGGGGGGDPGTHTVSGYAISGTGWRLRDAPSTSGNVLVSNINSGYCYVEATSYNASWYKVTKLFACSQYGNPSTCALTANYSSAYISADAIGSSATITYI